MILQSVLLAHCNHDLMSAGGYTSNNVALIPNDTFIKMMFKMLRPSSVSDGLRYARRSQHSDVILVKVSLGMRATLLEVYPPADMRS